MNDRTVTIKAMQERFASIIGSLDEKGYATRPCMLCESRSPVDWYIDGVCPFCGGSAEIDELRKLVDKVKSKAIGIQTMVFSRHEKSEPLDGDETEITACIVRHALDVHNGNFSKEEELQNLNEILDKYGWYLRTTMLIKKIDGDGA